MKPPRSLTIVVDLDDTLIQYSESEGLSPIPGAAQALKELRSQGHRIVIYTCRFYIARTKGKLKEESLFVMQLLNDFGIEFDELHLEDKPIADYYIDDRAIQFKGNWQETLEAVKPRD